MEFYDIPTGRRAPDVVNAIVEIPKGSRNKIEFDPELGVFRLDRVLYSSVHYPGDYGFIPGTLSPDGDALDVLVLVTEPTFAGCVLTVRPIGILEMRDEAGRDQKILAVPDQDPRFSEMRELGDIPQHLLTELQYFFSVYKDLEGKETAVLGWDSAAAAHTVIQDAIDAFAAAKDSA